MRLELMFLFPPKFHHNGPIYRNFIEIVGKDSFVPKGLIEIILVGFRFFKFPILFLHAKRGLNVVQ
jgi:hypothetical protein